MPFVSVGMEYYSVVFYSSIFLMINTIMKNLKEKLIKVIDKIDGFFLQFYPELTKHMNKKDDK